MCIGLGDGCVDGCIDVDVDLPNEGLFKEDLTLGS